METKASTSLAVPNQRQPRSDLIVGGQPNPEQLNSLAAEGLTMVIDLRGPEEDRGMDEKTTAEALGLAYHSIPVANRDALNWETAQQVHALLENATGTALVHCRSGNRVGAVFALDAAKSQGASLEEALEIGRAHGMTSLEEHIRPLLEAGTPP